tara:strand:- start:83 stop:232 length:150 start_codon:yes stop_codon:yes gene_type:complete
MAKNHTKRTYSFREQDIENIKTIKDEIGVSTNVDAVRFALKKTVKAVKI